MAKFSSFKVVQYTRFGWVEVHFVWALGHITAPFIGLGVHPLFDKRERIYICIAVERGEKGKRDRLLLAKIVEWHLLYWLSDDLGKQKCLKH